MQNMQTNVTRQLDNDGQMPYDNMFVWNAFLTNGIRQTVKNTRWTVALVHGFFEQVILEITICLRSNLCTVSQYLFRLLNFYVFQ